MNVRFFLKKTIRLVLSLGLFSFLLYGLLCLATGDPVLGVLRKLGVQQISPAALELFRTKLGLEGSFWQRYLKWLGQCLQGDFGYSFQTKQAVVQLIADKSKVTLLLVGVAFSICFISALTVGSLIANFPILGWLKHLLTVILSFPVYWLGLVVMFLFGVQLHLFPFVGSHTSAHFVLPILVLWLTEGCYLTKMVSDLLAVAATSQRQRVAKFRQIRWYYRLFYQWHETLIPILSLCVTSCLHLFSSVIMVEVIFSISGLGKLLLDAISTRDYPVIQGLTLLLAGLTFLLNYCVDLLMQQFDSRIRLERRGTL